MQERIRNWLRFSRLVLVLVLGVSVFLGWHASQIEFDFTLERLFESRDAELENYRRFQRDFGDDGSVVYIGLAGADMLATPARAMMARVSDALAAAPGVRDVFGVREALDFVRVVPADEEVWIGELRNNPLFRNRIISGDAKTACIWAQLDAEAWTEKERAAILARVRAILAEHTTGYEVHIAGLPLIEHEYARLAKKDLVTYLPLAVLLAFVLLMLYFRSASGTLLPLLSVFFAMSWTLGILHLLGMPITALSAVVPNLILVIGVADAIHLLSRHREDLARFGEKRDAIVRTVMTMGVACFLTSITTSIGFGSLLTTNVPAIREFGWVMALGIILAYVVSMTFVPGALDNLPRFRGRILERASERVWDRIMNGVARVNERGFAAVVGICAACVALSVIGLTKIERQSAWLEDIRSDNPVHRAHRFFQERLGGAFQIDLRLDGPPGALADPETLRQVDEFARRVAAWRGEKYPAARATRALALPDVLREVNRFSRVMQRRLVGGAPLEKLLAEPDLRTLPETRAAAERCLALYGRGAARQNRLLRLVNEDLSSCRAAVSVEEVHARELREFGEAAQRAAAETVPGLKLTVTGKSWLATCATDRIIRNMLISLGVA
ncbi:MAG: efflux RND transporter permease subunit, partial [Planctomycetota bacterium]